MDLFFLRTSLFSRSKRFCELNLCVLRWPTAATAKLTFPRQNLLSHGKTYFSMAKLTFSRQNLLFYGRTYFSTGPELGIRNKNLNQSHLNRSFKYFLVGDLILPGDLKNFVEETEVECVQSSFLSRVCKQSDWLREMQFFGNTVLKRGY